MTNRNRSERPVNGLTANQIAAIIDADPLLADLSRSYHRAVGDGNTELASRIETEMSQRIQELSR